MTKVQKALKTVGVSPKVLAALIVGIVTFAVTKLALPWDPILEQAVNVVATVVAAVVAGPGTVEVADDPPVEIEPALVD